MTEYLTRSNAVGLLYGGFAVGLHIWSRYRDWWWYDNVAHLSAGISLGSLVATEGSSLLQDLLAVAGLSASWELAEYLSGTYPWGDLPDRAAAEETLLDTVLVLLGAYIAARGVDR